MGRPITTKAFLLQLNLIYSAQVITMLTFGVIVFFQSKNFQQTVNNSFQDIMTIVVPGVLLAGLSAGYFIFKFQLNRVSSSAILKDKLKAYQVAMLIRSACLEVPALLGCVVTLVTGAIVFLYYTAAVLFIFFMLRPTAESISSDLALSLERNALMDPNAILYEA